MDEGILDWGILDTPMAVIDVETTGLNPGVDRVVEIAVVRFDGSVGPTVVYETVVNPLKPIPEAVVEKHRLTTDVVQKAPRFEVIAADLAKEMVGVALVGHNVLFDARMLSAELGLVGLQLNPPLICTMELADLIGGIGRLSLKEACQKLGVTVNWHSAAGDAMATAHVLQSVVETAHCAGHRTWRELEAAVGSRRFMETWRQSPVQECDIRKLTNPSISRDAIQPAAPVGANQASVTGRFPAYSYALLATISDFTVREDEMTRLVGIRDASGMKPEQVRAVHASVFSWVMDQYAIDGWVDDQERDYLRQLTDCLRKLGWAPGD